MQRVFGIGETILDILFKNNQPLKAVPGGSVFNSMITLGRLDVDTTFISEIGNDKVGEIVFSTLSENGINSDFVYRFQDGKSPISLAFLNEKNDAQYIFYKDYPNNRLDIVFPQVNRNDIVLYGSYFVLNPQIRNRVKDFLEHAHNQGAILIYDINFRANHKHERVKIDQALLENLELAHIIRGSSDDFMVLYELGDSKRIYGDKIRFYSSNFIYTKGADGIELFTKNFTENFEAKKINVLSTIGAGDNFNAGLVYGLLKESITLDNIYNISTESWRKIVNYGLDFSSQVCTSLDNYLDKEWINEHLG